MFYRIILQLLKYQVEPHEDAMQTKSCTLIITFSLLFLGMYVVESMDMNNNRQKRFTEVNVRSDLISEDYLFKKDEVKRYF